MNVRVGVAVMAHPRRTEFVNELVDDLDRNAEVVWDRRDDRWDTGSRALLAHRSLPEATHWMVVQDDAIVCRDLVAGTEKALNHLATITDKPTPLGLYIGRRFRRQCRLFNPNEVSWFTMPLYWGVAVVIPVDLIDDMVRWGHRHPHVENYDLRIGQWLKGRGITVWHPWPSMVDHRAAPSLVAGRGTSGRHAIRFLGSDSSALGHDWSGKTVNRIDRIRRRR